MPTGTYEKITSLTTTSSVATVSITSIPQTYTHLVAIVEANTNSGSYIYLAFNGTTSASSEYSYSHMFGDGSGIGVTASGENQYRTYVNNVGSAIGERSFSIIDTFDYTATNKFKPFLVRSNDQLYSRCYYESNRWSNTSAITSIVFSNLSTNTFNSGSKFTLYGIKG